ncbi:MAG TPA: putative DNA-binding domain-containing protein [Sphingorhabdus sp.]|nr:putative DNA-binding domain-containing protein [Sphingorhabdus sp.]
MSSLLEAQRNFSGTINKGPSALDPALFVGDADRIILGLKAHANTISHARLVALEQSFPMLHLELGDGAFNLLSREYVETGAARALDLNDIGKGFVAFLERCEIAAALIDLAAIEWAWLESFHAADAVPIGLGQLAGFDETRLLDYEVALHPAVRMRRLQAPLAQSLSELAVDGNPASILIARPEAEVRLLALDTVATLLIEKMSLPTSIGNLLSLACEHGHEADPIGPVLNLIGAGALIAME